MSADDSYLDHSQAMFPVEPRSGLAEPNSETEKEVMALVNGSKLIHAERARSEVQWFFHHLGLDDFYFRSMRPKTIAKHITGLYAAKVLNATTSEGLTLRLSQEKHSGALYIVPSQPSRTESNPSVAVEYRIETEYLQEGYQKASTDLCDGKPFRVQVYRTSEAVSEESTIKLRLFIVSHANLGEPRDISLPIVMDEIADPRYVDAATEERQQQMAEVLTIAQKQLGPAVRVFPVAATGDCEVARVVVAYRHGSTHSFFSGLTSLYHFYGLHSTHKYIERYSNGLCSFSLYLFKGATAQPGRSLMQLCEAVARDCSLVYVLPRTSISTMLQRGELNKRQLAYAYVLWKFTFQFYNRCGLDAPPQASGVDADVLSKMSASIKREMMTEARVKGVLMAHLQIVTDLYSDFEARFLPGGPAYVDEHIPAILNKISRAATTDVEAKLLRCMCMFNAHVLKTNFYKPGKVALSFRLDPSFLSSPSYPVAPYAIFFVVGAEFRGFHVRFVEVARGGIRIIRSPNKAAFAMNVSSLFEENYNLALTQQRKNKDIPEGGSKGTILLTPEHQDKALVAFQKYVDSLLDLLLPDQHIRDNLGTEELLFLGPDEGTADFMNWAAHHARERNYPFWKAFTTGKSRDLGGIPHDYYGMTTRSIHQFVMGIIDKQGLQESELRKFQTGGPDGDLGSNEIKISKDKTVAIVDGSGVLYDPEGINREEMVRLATARKMTDEFDVSKLSAKGFYVSVGQQDVALPNGTVVESGMMFRNTFHLQGNFLFGTDFFVPCGGRPAAVNASNVHSLYDESKNAPMFKYIVEGANLFFTQEARLQLEKWGVILFKDASANKGGVTSSSLEVLAALAFNDEEFQEHMQVRGDTVPAFYEAYVAEVHHIIESHARSEFECLWKEHQASRVPLSILSDQVSEKINHLNHEIFSSSLWNNLGLRERVISAAVPQVLIKQLGKETVLARVPDSYLKAIFGAHLAANFVYSHGLKSGEFGFFEFMQSYLQA